MSGKFATLGDLRGGGGKDADKSDKKKKTGNTLYTGGASSGLNVIGRGDDDDDDEHAGDVASKVFSRAGEAVQEKAGTTVKFWKNGFTVGDGDLRRMDDPANAPFLKAVTEGRVPDELRSFVGPDGDANVAFEDHRGEDYVPPAYRAYSGMGMRVGGVAAPDSAVAPVARNASAAAAAIAVNDAAPKAEVQVRLADGRREKVTLNTTHTVADLQAKVAAFKATPKAFVLLAGFPPKPLADPTATLEAAGLKGALVTQQAV